MLGSMRFATPEGLRAPSNLERCGKLPALGSGEACSAAATEDGVLSVVTELAANA